MPRVFNQKIKILYLMRVFLERTDEEHPMSVKELIIYLNSLGISAERKTVYDDIETLRNFGMDILNRREQPAGFYVASRKFELPELKLLVDAVQSSRFITSGSRLFRHNLRLSFSAPVLPKGRSHCLLSLFRLQEAGSRLRFHHTGYEKYSRSAAMVLQSA